jgi:hypothetical protein
MTYAAPRWGSKAIGTALIGKDSPARYYVDTVGAPPFANLFFTSNRAHSVQALLGGPARPKEGFDYAIT